MWNFMEKCGESWRILLSLSLDCSQFTQSSKDRLTPKWDFLHAAVTRREKEATENKNVSPLGFHALSEVISQTISSGGDTERAEMLKLCPLSPLQSEYFYFYMIWM